MESEAKSMGECKMSSITIFIKYGIIKEENGISILLNFQPHEWKKITDVIGGLAIQVNEKWITGVFKNNTPQTERYLFSLGR